MKDFLLKGYEVELFTGLKNGNHIGVSAAVANQFSDVRNIINYLKTNCESGDVVLIMSNGKFENIHQRLLDNL